MDNKVVLYKGFYIHGHRENAPTADFTSMGKEYAEENYKIAKAREQIKFGNDFERKILDVFSKISTSNLENETSTNIQRAL